MVSAVQRSIPSIRLVWLKLSSMDRIDGVFIVIGAIAVVVLFVLGESFATTFAGMWAVIAGATGLVAANHTIARRPKLVIEYRNPFDDDRSTVFVTVDGISTSPLLVYVRNEGRGPAEAVEVRFDRLGATHIFNEAGNGAPPELDEQHIPLLYVAGGRVLNSRQEWCMARLSWKMEGRAPDATASWRASAKGAPERSGIVRVKRATAPAK